MADAHGGTRNGSEWVAQCITDRHNEGWSGDPKWRFTRETATQSCETNSTSSLIITFGLI